MIILSKTESEDLYLELIYHDYFCLQIFYSLLLSYWFYDIRL